MPLRDNSKGRGPSCVHCNQSPTDRPASPAATKASRASSDPNRCATVALCAQTTDYGKRPFGPPLATNPARRQSSGARRRICRTHPTCMPTGQRHGRPRQNREGRGQTRNHPSGIDHRTRRRPSTPANTPTGERNAARRPRAHLFPAHRSRARWGNDIVSFSSKPAKNMTGEEPRFGATAPRRAKPNKARWHRSSLSCVKKGWGRRGRN